jgi:hypothetical protein
VRADADDDRRALIARAAPALAGAVLVAIFWFFKDQPENYDCGDDVPPGNAADVADFQAGMWPLHIAVALVALAAVVWLSRQRVRGEQRWLPIGGPTAVAIVLTVVLGYFLMLGGAILLAVIGGFAGAEFAAGLAIAVLLVAAATAVRRSSALIATVVAWLVLVLVPGHWLIVELQGGGPILC